ncbi:MAG: hypothetical protein ABIJ56_05270 [Pseudomonadota bacterium]
MSAGQGGHSHSGGERRRPAVSPGPPTLEEWEREFSKKVSRRAKHVDWLAIVLIITAVFYVILGLALGTLFITAPQWDQNINEQDKVVMPIVGVFFLVFLLLIAVWPAVSGWAIRGRKEWGRWSAVIFCAVTSPMACGSPCCLPITIWGIWALVGPEADAVFGNRPKPPPYLAGAQPPGKPADGAGEEKAGTDQEEENEPLPGYGDQPPSIRSPIPQFYPRPRITSKTPPTGVMRYEPPSDKKKEDDEPSQQGHSYSSLPTVKDITRPDTGKKK